ncbi:MAG: histidine phosphatase family protein [Chlamydiota bacterium]|nr:histidine phosphatase family protein [Chlamydiota bacterium]
MADKSNQFCTFYFVRHGKTEYNEELRLQGIIDTKLSKGGLDGAKHVYELIKGEPVDLIITNSLGRTGATAKYYSEKFGAPIEQDKLVDCRDWGEWNGRLTKDLLQFYPKNKNGVMGKPVGRIVGYHNNRIELYSEGVQRAKKFIYQTSLRCPGKTIIVVTHGFILNSLLSALKISGLHAPYCPHYSYLKIRSDSIKMILDEMYAVSNQIIRL